MIEAVKWKLPGLHKGIDAGKCYSEILEIGDTATAKQIVDRARDETSELHKCFEWDDTEAAEKWREHQARNVVNQLVVSVRQEDDKEPVNIRVMHIADNPHEYKQTRLIVQNADEYASLLSRAMAELKAFRDKYKTLSELEQVFDAIDLLV